MLIYSAAARREGDSSHTGPDHRHLWRFMAMAARRSINFIGAMHEMRAERRQPATVLRNADGSFNKSGIMREAIRLARQLRGGLIWARKLSISLRTAWQKARMAHAPRLAA